ncbi:General transcription factor II-I repeat domain-containing protein 2A-like [Oopsacas minuta]|uniref:General transcription factor II-I repeat domain-containing protein 2A-like n=1 Tax=Oopsacas minuta TaxID=111878 RepID=A0AAV7K4U2_9METZ|nr:General transcription factor II-I repeat domain-containing protein 2A-like [Oopsacas minuta]
MLNSMTSLVTAYHCIIHQEQLCAKILDMKHVMENVVNTVNFIKSKGLNHRQFQAFLTEVGSDYNDVIYFSQVRWLSRASTLARYWSLLEEIKTFMTIKGKDVSLMDDDQWLNDLAFLVDITKYLADLNLKLQGRKQFVNNLYEHVKAFINKLQLVHQQFILKKMVHFSTLSSRKSETVNHDKYSALINSLIDEFKLRFSDFSDKFDEMELFADPFGTDATNAPEMFQLELIGIQNNSKRKRAFAEHDLLIFYGQYVTSDLFPNLSQHALRFVSLFGSTYCCEQLFSMMKNVKSKSRSLLIDTHLSGILRIATSSVRADIDSV